jgi:hypothetical protein
MVLVFFLNLEGKVKPLNPKQHTRKYIMKLLKMKKMLAQPHPAEIIFSKIKTVFRYINAKNRNMSVSDKLDNAISKLNYEDFTGAIKYVKTFVNDNY